MQTAVWLPITTAFLGALAGILGVTLNQRLSAGSTLRQWQRDRLADKCEHMMTALDNMREAAEQVQHMQEDEALAPLTLDEADEIEDQVVKANAALRLYVSDDTSTTAYALHLAFKMLVRHVNDESARDKDGEAWFEQVMEFADTFGVWADRMEGALRKELGR